MTEKTEEKTEEKVEIPSLLPVLSIKGAVVYPYLIIPLVVSKQKLIRLVDETLAKDKVLVLVTQKDASVSDPGPDDLYQVGTAAIVVKMLRFPDGSLRLLAQGISRIRIQEYMQTDPYLVARVEQVLEPEAKGLEAEALMRNVMTLFQQVAQLAPYLPDELQTVVMNIDEPGRLADFIASNINFDLQEKQMILEAVDPVERLRKLTPLLTKELSVLELGAKIRSDVKSEIDKGQREYYLREQLKAIHRELGEKDERAAEIEEIRAKIEEAGLPEEARKAAEQELDRLTRIPPAAAEYTVARTYLDWIVSLPWSVATEDNLDIEGAQQTLDEDHFDLEDVKDRIIEYLAVRKLNPESKGPILCFVGPPGVGKTSLGRSIARTLGRKFIRFSLGGVRDEAEIRGHRRTYVGALPGRVIQGIRRAESRNPVFMLDEVDKIGMDFRGDPAAALLEVLDPEQNNTFRDHYLDLAFDLSQVMFITTANIVDPIPPALKDRMEMLELPGYTQEEKLEIARRYLVPRQITENGLKPEQVSFTDDAIVCIVRQYTREAGVRNLEREIGSVCRKIAKGVASGKEEITQVTEATVKDFLGPVKFIPEVAERACEPGVATGVAWTPAGGEILFVEATKMRGKKTLTLTGHLGDVMKESAQAALSYVRAHADSLGIDDKFFENYDIHIHVPSGAIPKDGPSAGMTMAVALASLLSGRTVDPRVAMTGEITLRGRVLPVGGIKEKVLAAKRAGIDIIIMPEKNKKDLEDIPEVQRKGLEFRFVSTIGEAFDIALCDGRETSEPSEQST
jgi:ATP-dependent Lon protease